MGVVADLGLGHLSVDEIKGPSGTDLGRVYGEAKGLLPLREEVASWEGVSVGEVTITTGASLGLVATLTTLRRPCSILCPRPYYPLYPMVAKLLGIDIIYYELSREYEWQPILTAVRRAIRADTRAIILNFPGNPAGNLPSENLLSQLERVVRDFDLTVISDEVYSDFIYTSQHPRDLRPIFGHERFVRLRSFSKLFGIPGERLGYVIAHAELLDAIAKAHWALAMSPPATAQTMAHAGLRYGAARRVKELRESLVWKRDYAAEILETSKTVRFKIPDAGIFFWLEIPNSPLDSITLAKTCASIAGVVVVAGAHFGVDPPVYLRASFAVDTDSLSRGFKALTSFLRTVTMASCA